MLLSVGLRAADNVFVVSETIGALERIYGVRAKTTAWFVQADGSTLNVSFPGKGDVNFHLQQTAPSARLVDQIQVEPMAGALSLPQANAYAAAMAAGMAREGWACAPLRNDQDGINAFIIYSCTEKSAPAAPTEMAVTIQSVGGRNLVFVRFSPKKR
jgi:hypothetical protein